MPRILRCSVTALAVAVVVTGCVFDATEGKETGAAGEKGNAAVSVPRPSVDLTLPLDEYDLTPTQLPVVRRARFMLVNKCMKTFGLSVEVPPTEPITYPKNGNYLGWLGELQVEKYGYAGRPGAWEEAVVASDGVYSVTVTDDQYRVLDGKVRKFHGKTVPVGGCGGSVEAVLAGKGPVRSWYSFEEGRVGTFAADAADRAYKDSRMRDAERVWSGCMKRAGFDYATPSDAQGDPRWASTAKEESPGPRGTPAEIAVATADHRCRLETDYYGARRTANADAQRKIMAEHSAFLEELKKLNQTHLENAAKVLAGDIKSPW
ncbi:hypothetical protein [Streptosporangium carneum]|uniref:Lipoprotein n=1 Tax=Streptosporangium carneum TaxID=47481 RepID=A0A9W6I8T2_9ACTN|nr:hypothetical protein [Streptosporangium carneum]GLK13084.1 hypothetical protein GCM10017600_64950 [Streptosporangium carneum]